METNGPRDQWLAALASNYELLPRERDGGLEQRETKERRVADLRTFARYTIKFTIESNAIRRYTVVGLAGTGYKLQTIRFSCRWLIHDSNRRWYDPLL